MFKIFSVLGEDWNIERFEGGAMKSHILSMQLIVRFCDMPSFHKSSLNLLFTKLTIT